MVSGTVLATLAANGFEHPTACCPSVPRIFNSFSASSASWRQQPIYLDSPTCSPSRTASFPVRCFAALSAGVALRSFELNVSRVIMMSVFLYMLYDVYRYYDS